MSSLSFNRIFCIDDLGHLWTMKMLTRHWTKQEQRTKMCFKLKRLSKSVVRNLKKYLNRQNKVLEQS